MDHVPFDADALTANRGGRLTDRQAAGWREVARANRGNVRGLAYTAAAIGVLLLIANGPASKAASREAVALACLGIAAVLLFASRLDRLTADLREGRVESVEGAIGKHVVQGSGRSSATSHFIDVANHHLRVGRTGYDAAPDAAIVRAYYLPRSHRLVNLERLPDRPLPAGPDVARQVVDTFASALRAHDPTAIAEARATAAAMEDTIRGPVPDGSSTPATADQLYGTWSNLIMSVTFARDGTATLTLPGGTRRTGHWSVDTSGRLLTDAAGRMEPVDASLSGNHLTVTFGGQRVTFTRAADA